jgi:hypothetical protein
MADQLRVKPGADSVPIAIGDMRTTRVNGAFRLVYLVWNSIMNVTTQDGQVEVFQNAAALCSILFGLDFVDGTRGLADCQQTPQANSTVLLMTSDGGRIWIPFH